MSKNPLLPTNDQFRADYPEFEDKIRFPDASVNFYLAMADNLLNQDKFGDMFVNLAELMTAHYVELRARRTAAAKRGALNTSGGGVATSKSVDKVSVSYDVSSIIDPNAGFWNNTDYGREFFWWWEKFGAGGRQLL